MYRIALFLPKLKNSAPIVYHRNIVAHLALEFQFTVFFFDGVVDVEFPCKMVRINFKDKLRFEDFDLLHSFGFLPDLYLSLNRRKFVVPIISTMHSYLFNDLKSQFNFLLSVVVGSLWLLNLRKFDKIVCLTSDMKEYYSRFFNSDKLVYIYTGHSVDLTLRIDSNDISLIKTFKSDRILLGVFANLTYQKGLDHVIKFISTSDHYKLLIIGEGKYKNELIRIASKFGAIDKCLFLGRRDNAHRFFKLIDMYVLSSYQEGFGLVGLESSIYKVPMICNDIPVFREIYDDDVLCFYDCKDADSFQLALKKTMENKVYYSRKIGDLSQFKYNIDLMCSNYSKMYITQMLTSKK